MKRLIHNIKRRLILRELRKRYTAIIITALNTGKYDVDASLFLAEQAMKFMYPNFVVDVEHDDNEK